MRVQETGQDARKGKSLYEHLVAFQRNSHALLSVQLEDRMPGGHLFDRVRPDRLDANITLFPGYSLDFTQGAWLMYCINAGIHHETGLPHRYQSA